MPLTHKPGTHSQVRLIGDGARSLDLCGKPVEAPDGRLIQAAASLFLQPIGERADEKFRA
jgi:hypothetical protein